MKIEVIPVSDLEPFLDFVKKEREMQVLLTQMLEAKKRQVEKLKHIKVLASNMQLIKSKYKFKTDKEMTMVIRKYADLYNKGI